MRKHYTVQNLGNSPLIQKFLVAGLGSSAAFSVALAGALIHLQNGRKRRSEDEEADRYVICKWAFKSEKIIHGNPSGKKKLYFISFLTFYTLCVFK